MRLGLFIGSIALSLVVAFATGGFWTKSIIESTQATVHYTYDALLVFGVSSPTHTTSYLPPVSLIVLPSIMQGNQAGQEMFWSTSEVINDEFSQYYVPAAVQVSV